MKGEISTAAPATGGVSFDDLYAQRAWVRALARALTRDESDAEDVEQQVWLAAVRSPPRAQASARGWLARVAGNAARRAHRTRSRRTRRETEAAGRARPPHSDPAELAARAEVHARVATAVAELREPYREALLLRYFEGCAPAEVATRTGVPYETAKARLRRGRQILRARLAQDGDRGGGGADLAVVLAPLLTRDSGTASAVGATGGIGGGAVVAMSVLGKCVAGGAALLAVSAAAWWLTRDGDRGAEVAGVERAESTQPVSSKPAPVQPERERVPVVSEDPPVAPPDLRDDGEDATARAGPADEPARPDVESLLAEALPSFRLEGVPNLRVAFGRLSGASGVPIYVDARAVRSIESGSIQLHFEGAEVRQALRTMCMLSGLSHKVLDDRVVVYSKMQEWTDGGATELIEPVQPDPDAPTAIVVRGRVVDVEGVPVAGARIVGRIGARALATVGADGRYEVSIPGTEVTLTATAPFRQRSTTYRAFGELGDELERDFEVGGEGGGVSVVVVDGEGAPIEWRLIRSAQLSWPDASSSTRIEFGGSRVPAFAFRLLPGRFGAETIDFVPPGRVRVDVRALGHRPKTTFADVEARETTAVRVVLEPQSMEERLRELRTTFAFEGESPRTIARYIASTNGLNVVVAPEAVSTATISLEVTDDTVASALRQLCNVAGDLTFRIDENEIIHIEPR